MLMMRAFYYFLLQFEEGSYFEGKRVPNRFDTIFITVENIEASQQCSYNHSHENISEIVDSRHDPTEEHDYPKERKQGRNRHTQKVSNSYHRSSSKNTVSGRKWIVWKMIDKRWKTRYRLWSWSHRKSELEYPIDSECEHDGVENIERDDFVAYIFLIYSVEP